MKWLAIIRFYIAASLVIAGGQFTHANSLHETTGHFGHQHPAERTAQTASTDHEHHAGDEHHAGHGHPGTLPVEGQSGSNQAHSEGGLHCGAPMLGVCDETDMDSPPNNQTVYGRAVNTPLFAHTSPEPPPPRT